MTTPRDQGEVTVETTDLATQDERAIDAQRHEPLSPTALMMRAIDKGMDPDGLAKIAQLVREEEDRQAERAFNAALLRFQNLCPVFTRRKQGDKAKFTPLEYLKRGAQPHLDACGLAVSQTTSQIEHEVVCFTTVRHTLGHKETTETRVPMSTPQNSSGRAIMNPAQQVGSAISYARRYGFCLALNIVTGDEDDDGAAAGDPGAAFLTEEQIANLEALMSEAGADTKRFLKFLGVTEIGTLPQSRYKKAVTALQEKIRRGTS